MTDDLRDEYDVHYDYPYASFKPTIHYCEKPSPSTTTDPTDGPRSEAEAWATARAHRDRIAAAERARLVEEIAGWLDKLGAPSWSADDSELIASLTPGERAYYEGAKAGAEQERQRIVTVFRQRFGSP